MAISKRKIRLGEERVNNKGQLMKIVEYNNANDMVVEFQDEYKTRVRTVYHNFKKGLVKNKISRLGETNNNYQGAQMKIVKYNNSTDVVVEFQDKNKARVHTTYYCFLHGWVSDPMLHIGELNNNNQGCSMKIVGYNTGKDVSVEFQDKYKTIVHTQYDKFKKGDVRNPYYASVCSVGIPGLKYPISHNSKNTKEYCVWQRMIMRFSMKRQKKNAQHIKM